MTKYPPITYDYLKSKDTCSSQLEIFRKSFGDLEAPLDNESVIKYANVFDFFLAPKSLLETEDARVLTLMTALAQETYWAIKDQACRVSNSYSDPNYRKLEEPTRTAYKKTIALTFVRLYRQEV